MINPSSADLCDQEDQIDKYNIDESELIRQVEIKIDKALAWPEVLKEPCIDNRRRMRSLKKKRIKKEYIRYPENTDIKLATVNFKKWGKHIIY